MCSKGRFWSVHWWRFIVWCLWLWVLILIKHSPGCSWDQNWGVTGILEYRIVQISHRNSHFTGLDRTISGSKASYYIAIQYKIKNTYRMQHAIQSVFALSFYGSKVISVQNSFWTINCSWLFWVERKKFWVWPKYSDMVLNAKFSNKSLFLAFSILFKAVNV